MTGLLSSILIFASFFLLPSSFVHASASQTDLPSQVCLRSVCLNVEIADTDEKRMRGLQERGSLPENKGMLFIFPSEGVYKFWMKETLIPLDMIWLDKERKVVGFAEQVPPCREDPCSEYGPSENALFVLEANAGFVTRLGVKTGDTAVFK